MEQSFIRGLSLGMLFTLPGRNLELVMIKNMQAWVRKWNERKSIVQSWNGGRMPLSANLGMMLRRKLDEASEMLAGGGIELKILQPLFELQTSLPYMPRENELLIEQIETTDGFYRFVYPFTGRCVTWT